MKATDQLIEQNRQLQEQNRRLIDEINLLWQALAAQPQSANADPAGAKTVSAALTGGGIFPPSRIPRRQVGRFRYDPEQR